MSRKKQTSMPETESEEIESETQDDLAILEAYIEASEMYLEVLKLNLEPIIETNDLEMIATNKGMKAVYFAKASLAYADTPNKDILKNSIKHAIRVYNEAISYMETNNIEDSSHFCKAAKLVISSLTNLK